METHCFMRYHYFDILLSSRLLLVWVPSESRIAIIICWFWFIIWIISCCWCWLFSNAAFSEVLNSSKTRRILAVVGLFKSLHWLEFEQGSTTRGMLKGDYQFQYDIVISSSEYCAVVMPSEMSEVLLFCVSDRETDTKEADANCCMFFILFTCYSIKIRLIL